MSTSVLPRHKPRYLMGVGYSVDLVVCSALGVDMYDCVYPTRTARFGNALLGKHPGYIDLRSQTFRADSRPLEEGCNCSTCKHHSRAYVHAVSKEPSACHLITVHNVAFQLRLMANIREAITKDSFPDFVKKFMVDNFPDKNYPQWVVDALRSVNINIIT